MVKSAHTTKAPKIGFDGLSPSKALPTLCEGRKLTAKQNSYRAIHNWRLFERKSPWNYRKTCPLENNHVIKYSLL